MYINKLLQDVAFRFTATFDGTSVTMIDTENVVALRPKPLSGPDFIAIKKDIGNEQYKAQQ